jgi:predicted NBD/HSP70 family sugar kinase
MQNKSINKTIIGWDIGGAHIKYCVISDNSNIIWYDIMDLNSGMNIKISKIY